jgi:MFS family permease
MAIIPGMISLLVLIYGVKEERTSDSSFRSKVQFSLQPFPRRFKLFLLVIVLFAFGNSSDAFLILKARDTGIPVALIPVLWMVLHISKSLSSTPGGILSDRLGRKGVIVIGWLLYSGVYFGFAGAQRFLTIWVLFALYGLFYGLTEGGERALVADLVSPALRGTAYGLYHFATGIMAVPASLLMGLLWAKVGSPIAFAFGAFLALASAVLLWQWLNLEKKVDER